MANFQLYLLLCTSAGVVAAGAPPLVVLVLDGFRWDYPELLLGDGYRESTMRLLATEGVRAEFVHPGFPSNSYPSWTTIATGRYAEVHGIVGNYMYDRKIGDFSLYEPDLTSHPDWWNTGSDPIWTTATKQDIKTANIMFSRCDVLISGVKPAFCQRYGSAPGRGGMHRNLQTALHKLDQGYQLVIAYVEHLDTTGHYNVQTSVTMEQAMKDVDEELAIFLDGLKQRKMFDKVNFMLVSDHGMTEVSSGANTNYLHLDLYMPPSLAEKIIENGAFVQIVPLPGQRETILEALRRMPNVTVLTKDQLPKEFHYSNNNRIPEIMVSADPGCAIVSPRTENTLPSVGPEDWSVLRGIHGYQRNLTDMRTVFYAMGPDFKRGYRQPAIELVDEYQVMAHVLQLVPLPHNGSWERVSGMFADDGGPAVGGAIVAPLVALCALLIVFWRRTAGQGNEKLD